MSLLKTTLAALIAFGGLTALMYFAQRKLMYFPETLRTTPAAAGLPEAEEVLLDTADGERVIVWHLPPRGGRPVVLYFHGNGGALRYRVQRFRAFMRDGNGLVALSYRGYGGSTGAPTEAGLLADAEAAYAFAAARYAPERLVLWGESLGGGVAVALAARRHVGRVVLEAAFTSAADVGAAVYWFLPVRLLMKDQFRSDQRIGQVKAPLLFLHGTNDNVVPLALGERLFALANEPKHMVRFPGGGHNDLDDHGAQDVARPFIAQTAR
ncbi:MAG TPA: alpha/beta hydrolase [Xanthobacteraceae bacterium]|nr:alpha/beta hydrolase [Xanthobacteraceae bacterium]